MTKASAYKHFAVIILVALISVSGIALPYPILAPIFMDEVATDFNRFLNIPAELLFAVALAIYPLGILVGSSFIGALSDLFGRRSTLTVTLFFAALGYCFTAWAVMIEHYPLFILARFLTGLCEGNVSVCRALALDLDPHIEKTRAMSLLNATFYTGYLVGPLAGGYLMDFGNDAAFWVAAVATLFALAVVHFLLGESTQPKEKASLVLLRSKIITHNSFRLLKERPIRRVFIIYLLLAMGINSLYEYYPLWLVTDFAASSMQIGIATAVLTLFMIISSAFAVTYWKHRLGLATGAMIAMFGLTASLFSYGLYDYSSLLWIGFPITGCFIALVNGMMPVYFSERFGEFGQGRIMGLLTSTFCLANVVMALLGGIIALLSPLYSIFFGAVLILFSMFLFKFQPKNS
ncbi:MFS transporter [Catenovulum sp. SM1970]|uniref:MFS transporter n=1 Tax=Marinifaba aquimaris TaxID=2741323 RepID=UPI001574C086|nr:MFS transporter [Marinifaba aquimaris]NTS77286.1 MFS transporter [Marinifaba aquimaris]